MKTHRYKDAWGNIWIRDSNPGLVWNAEMGFGLFDHGRGLIRI